MVTTIVMTIHAKAFRNPWPYAQGTASLGNPLHPTSLSKISCTSAKGGELSTWHTNGSQTPAIGNIASLQNGTCVEKGKRRPKTTKVSSEINPPGRYSIHSRETSAVPRRSVQRKQRISAPLHVFLQTAALPDAPR
jgi:hypothetical protein